MSAPKEQNGNRQQSNNGKDQQEQGQGQKQEGNKKEDTLAQKWWAAQKGKDKIGSGHVAAMARLGLKELRNALDPSIDNRSVSDSEIGLYGTQTQGEIARAREEDPTAFRSGDEEGAGTGTPVEATGESQQEPSATATEQSETEPQGIKAMFGKFWFGKDSAAEQQEPQSDVIADIIQESGIQAPEIGHDMEQGR